MSIYDYVSGAKEGKRPYHSHEFADKKRQEHIGSTAVSPFQKRKELEKKRKAIGAYKISKVAYDMDAKRALIREQKRQKDLHKVWLIRQSLSNFPRALPAVEMRTIPTIQQYRYKPVHRKKKRFSKVYMAQPESTASKNSENIAETP